MRKTQGWTSGAFSTIFGSLQITFLTLLHLSFFVNSIMEENPLQTCKFEQSETEFISPRLLIETFPMLVRVPLAERCVLICPIAYLCLSLFCFVSAICFKSKLAASHEGRQEDSCFSSLLIILLLSFSFTFLPYLQNRFFIY